MNEKNNEEIKKIPFDGIIIDAEEVISRNERGLAPQEEAAQKLTANELRGISRYKKLNIMLGEGGFKKVYKAIDQIEGKEVAWNEVKITENEYNNKGKTSFFREITLLNKINHQSILAILDYWFTKEKFIFITEIMSGGTLKEYIGKIGEVNIKVLKKWTKQILEGLHYLHSQNPPVIHRDIKCENIFVDSSSGEVKIGDLGVAKEKRLKRYTVVGTPQFMAREMFEGDGYSEKVDIYAFGMCLIEMATGCYPYKECEDSSDVYRSILQGVPPTALYNVTDPCLKNLILRCLVLEKDRLDAKTALNHHFLDVNYVCPGDCIPKESILVKPLTTPGHDMEISLISFEADTITFQLFFMSEAKFIKFDYNVITDTVELVAKEMLDENVVEYSKKDVLINMLRRGVQRAIERREIQAKEDSIEYENMSINIKCIENSCNNLEAEFSDLKIDDCMSNSTLELKDAIDSNMTQECLSKIKEDIECTRCQSSDTLVESPLKSSTNNAQPSSNINDCSTSLDEANNGHTNACTDHSNVIEGCSNIQDSTTNGRNITSDKCTARVRANVSNMHVNAQNELSTKANEQSGLFLHTKKISEQSQPSILTKMSSPPSSNLEELTCRTMVYPIKKYDNNVFIEEFAYDTAEITRRSTESANNWIKILRSNDIYNTTDLRILVEEDWDKLGLSVFISRAMKNMLYGLDQHPFKEKHLPDNVNIKMYCPDMSIGIFLKEVTEICNKKECLSAWENKLLAQDIRTVEELKSLHQDDWDRIGLSLFSYRVLKNIIFRKGKFV